MGFGKLFSQQNQLTSLSNAASVEAGKAQQSSANMEASALQAQGALASAQSQEQAALTTRQANIEAGVQQEGYLSSGVEDIGTPMAVTNETRSLGQIQANAQTEQGQLENSLYNARAVMAANEGNQAALQGEIGADTNTLSNDISQTQTENNVYQGLYGGVASGGLSILESLLHT